MARQITNTVYEFDELSPKAKERARDWWKNLEGESFGHDDPDFYDPIVEVGGALGIEFEHHGVPLMSGKSRQEPRIFWSLHTQGSGACFNGNWSFAPGAVAWVAENYPQDKVLAEIAATLAEHPTFTARCRLNDNHYVHSGCMEVDVDSESSDGSGHNVRVALRQFGDWIYRWIDVDYSARMENENVDDCIRCNEYEFTAAGDHYHG